MRSFRGDFGVEGRSTSVPEASDFSAMGLGTAAAEPVDSFDLWGVVPVVDAGFLGGGMVVLVLLDVAGVLPRVDVLIRELGVVVDEGLVPWPIDCLNFVGLDGAARLLVVLLIPGAGLRTEELKLLPGVIVERLSLLDVVPLLAVVLVGCADGVGPADMRFETPLAPTVASSPDVNVSISEDRRDVAVGRRVDEVAGGRVGGLFKLLPGAARVVDVGLLGVLDVVGPVARLVVDEVVPGRLGAPAAEPVRGRLGGTFSAFEVLGEMTAGFFGFGVLVSRSDGRLAGSLPGISAAAGASGGGCASVSAMVSGKERD